MQKLLDRVQLTIKHLEVLHNTFINRKNFSKSEDIDFQIYEENLLELEKACDDIHLYDELYSEKNRQMILADLYEYIFLGRGFYVMKSETEKEKFVKSILFFVNLLMCYESITVSDNLRTVVLNSLKNEIPQISKESNFKALLKFKGKVGLPEKLSTAPKELNKYFDKILPKTAGGLWHELLVYIFLLRSNKGYILPLLLTQKLFAKEDHLVPPDFLIISHDKRIYGIEVGTKKEIQSGSFSIKTAIPTATIDTINSRNSDRCPSCLKWIQFCPYVIEKYSNFKLDLPKTEVRCLDECTKFKKRQILNGECKYSKYSRGKASTLPHANHDFANGLHYHYACVLKNVSVDLKRIIISASDTIAIKSHYPNYAGLEELNK